MDEEEEERSDDRKLHSTMSNNIPPQGSTHAEAGWPRARAPPPKAGHDLQQPHFLESHKQQASGSRLRAAAYEAHEFGLVKEQDSQAPVWNRKLGRTQSFGARLESFRILTGNLWKPYKFEEAQLGVQQVRRSEERGTAAIKPSRARFARTPHPNPFGDSLPSSQVAPHPRNLG